ncbi:carotenoid oxygenase family protein [Microseira wollei]|uniref:Carotenoid oxygenase n=1 Tax=Microseira wollei NIES-4236 TaxID=2530354 RepID=A0AAV3XIP4_9CYAN|nr:carotenoid oxygenase family protein [Microseira wollei]GET40860.1 carotenoid oxygenase [Microseira wollei NIES-4236]
MTTSIINPYLSGNFAPVKEEITAENLQIIGELPSNFSGLFLRSGPNPQFPPIGRYHWFDGDGMVHGVLFSNGKASYRNRYVRTKAFEKEREAGQAIWTGCLEPLQKNNLPPSRFSVFKNTANTTPIWHAGKLLALCEGQEPYILTVPDLETIGSYDYNGKLTHPLCAHPKIDPETEEMMVIGYSMWQKPYLKYSIISANGELLKTVPIDLPRPVMMHDFAITENYTIILDLPLTLNPSPQRVSAGEPWHSFRSNLPSRIGIFKRYGDSDSIRWFEGPAFYIPHTLNAYEEGDEIVMIATRVSAMGISTTVGEPIFYGGQPQLYEWRFNLRTGEWREKMLDDVPAEYPVINERRHGRKNQYGYMSKIATDREYSFNGLIKYDFIRGESQTYEFASGCYNVASVFAPNVTGTAEDDGWLITYVYNEDSKNSELAILDARNIQAGPVARILMPQRVPNGFHCHWVSEAQLHLSK